MPDVKTLENAVQTPPQPWQSSVLGWPTSTLRPGTVNLRLMHAPENSMPCLHKPWKTTTARLTACCDPNSVCKILALLQLNARRGP